MKKLFTNPDYSAFYKVYKLLPMIYAALVLLAGLVFGIVDACMEITEIGDLEAAAVPIWLIIGAVASAIVLWLSSIIVSPTIVRTDAIIEINKKLNPQYCNTDTNSEQPHSYSNTDTNSEQLQTPPATPTPPQKTESEKKDFASLLKNITPAKKRTLIIIFSIALLIGATTFALDMIGVL